MSDRAILFLQPPPELALAQARQRRPLAHLLLGRVDARPSPPARGFHQRIVGLKSKHVYGGQHRAIVVRKTCCRERKRCRPIGVVPDPHVLRVHRNLCVRDAIGGRYGVPIAQPFHQHAERVDLRLRSRSAEAEKLMHYYWDTIRSCVPPETILDALRGAGFTDAKRHVELGTFSEYMGVKVRPSS